MHLARPGNVAIFLFVLLGVGLFAPRSVTESDIHPLTAGLELERYKLVWHDEFDGGTLNSDNWSCRSDSRKWSTQRQENVSVTDGQLRISLRKEYYGGKEYTGGGVISKKQFKYGYYEARLKCPPGEGWHTSFWLMKAGSVGTADHEFDVVEQDSVDHYSYALNLHNYSSLCKTSDAFRVKTPDLSESYHVWGCEVTSLRVRFFFDGKQVADKDVSAIGQSEHNIWLTSIAADLGGTRRVDENALPSVVCVDYVRVYQHD